MNNLPIPVTPATPETAWAYMQECNRYLTALLAESHRQNEEYKREFTESQRILNEKFTESQRLLDEKFAETDRRMKETDRQMKETDRRMKVTDKEIEKNWKQIRANTKDIWGISKSNGEIVESYFFNSFKKYPNFAGQEFQSVERNKKCDSTVLNLRAEYDLLLHNGSSVAIIETKQKVRKDDVEQILNKAETFKKMFPLYREFYIYLGLAGFHFYQNAEDEAIKQGIAIIKQVGKNMVINDAHLKVF